MNEKQQAELVNTELSINTDSANVDIDIEGEYPLKVNNHFVMASVENDNRKFRCVTCGNEIRVSEAVWRKSEPSCRYEATKYIIGYFLDGGCSSPETFRDVVDSAITPYIGEVTSRDTMRHIEKDLKHKMIDYE